MSASRPIIPLVSQLNENPDTNSKQSIILFKLLRPAIDSSIRIRLSSEYYNRESPTPFASMVNPMISLFRAPYVSPEKRDQPQW